MSPSKEGFFNGKKEFMSEFITSAGSVGADYNRSEGRAYLTEGEVICHPQLVRERFDDLRVEALNRGRRRWVYRAILEGELEKHPFEEVNIPLSYLNKGSTRKLIILGENVHVSVVPEWESVYSFWQKPYKSEIDPLGCVRSVLDQFELTKSVQENDIRDLTEIWRPFGWTIDGIRSFLDIQNQPNIWFSGIVERTSGRLVSACQGEGICFGETLIVESTEFGTHIGFEGRGLCTAAVVGLNAQILDDTEHLSTGLPLIYSELSMTSRSDTIARKAGMMIPLVEGQTGLMQPAQVLKRNVSILDGYETNGLELDQLGEDVEHFREAFGSNYRYWRNFIAGILPEAAVNRYYSADQRQQILGYYRS